LTDIGPFIGKGSETDSDKEPKVLGGRNRDNDGWLLRIFEAKLVAPQARIDWQDGQSNLSA
jgi:hypothetical protein